MAHTPAAVPARRRLFQHPGRVAIIAITLLVALNLGIFLINESDTTTTGDKALPVDVEAVSPAPNAITTLVDTVTADLADQYTGVLVIDGVEIPEDQLERVVGIQTVSFRPGPDKVISRFRSGVNQVVVRYWNGRLQDRPARPFSYNWQFVAKA
ncbi:MAG TPA: hypothetical protein VGN51_16520 [Acidimicrobiia bacterium]|jgi:hypothetical protein